MDEEKNRNSFSLTDIWQQSTYIVAISKVLNTEMRRVNIHTDGRDNLELIFRGFTVPLA